MTLQQAELPAPGPDARAASAALSRLIADKGNRTIARVAQSVATAVFLPVMALR